MPHHRNATITTAATPAAATNANAAVAVAAQATPPKPRRRRLPTLAAALFAAAAAFAAATDANAEIVWSNAKGWQAAQGTMLSGEGLVTFEQRFDGLELLTRARRAQTAGSVGKAIDLYEDVLSRYPRTELACEAHFQCGVLYHSRNQFENAFHHLNVVVRHYPEFPRYNEVIANQYRIATAIKNGERPYLWGWIPWFTDNSRGLDYFEQVNRNGPQTSYADKALFDKGTFASELDRTPEAIDAFERLIYDYADSPLVPNAILALAKTHELSITGHEWDQSATRNALFFYNEFVTRYPSHKRTAEAVKSAARMRETLAKNRYDLALFFYEERNNARAAAHLFNEAINAAPTSKTAQDARIKLADIRAGKLAPRGAMDWLLGRYPVTRDASYIDPSSHTDLDKMGFQAENKGPAK
jgi:outer membrane protein assembly factor BamD